MAQFPEFCAKNPDGQYIDHLKNFAEIPYGHYTDSREWNMYSKSVFIIPNDLGSNNKGFIMLFHQNIFYTLISLREMVDMETIVGQWPLFCHCSERMPQKHTLSAGWKREAPTWRQKSFALNHILFKDSFLIQII